MVLRLTPWEWLIVLWLVQVAASRAGLDAEPSDDAGPGFLGERRS